MKANSFVRKMADGWKSSKSVIAWDAEWFTIQGGGATVSGWCCSFTKRCVLALMALPGECLPERRGVTLREGGVEAREVVQTGTLEERCSVFSHYSVFGLFGQFSLFGIRSIFVFLRRHKI